MQLPLKDITVIELGHSVAAPIAGMILAELGATVVKVENPGGGDDARNWGPPFMHGAASTFQSINRNKHSIAADMKDPATLETLRRFIVEKADIVVQNMRPGLVERYGLDAATLRARKPSLIYCNMTAFGSAGPMKDAPGYDPLLQAFGGLMSVTGHPGQEPVRTGPSIIDQGAGMWAVIGILTALLRRKDGGDGCVVDTSLFETALSWMCMHVARYLASGQVPGPGGSENGGMAPYKAYEASDGWVVIAAANDNLFRRLAGALGHPEWPQDPQMDTNANRVRNRQRVNAAVAEVIITKPRQYWLDTLAAVSVPCSALHTLDEVLSHPQTEAVGIVQESADRKFKLVGLPLQFDGERPAFRKNPPALAEDNDMLLQHNDKRRA